KALSLVDWANKQINDQEPWNLFKEGKLEQLGDLLYEILETLRQVAILLAPITPVLSPNIWSQLGYPESAYKNATWDTLKAPHLEPGQTLNLQGPLLLRLDSEIVGAGKKK
ncbi:MAG: methionine--tRNA ligase, partial [Cyanobacteria bacterium]|nr:methionine--tRNA ligase [Cyanobacteriota bacterium]